MTSANRLVIIAGNWKMYKTIPEAVAFIQELKPLVQNSPAKIYLAVPFTAIKSVSDVAKESNIVVGAQNMNDVSEGSFTGEISGKMLKDAGAKFVIIGHSERRRLFHETDSLINKKAKRALLEGLQAILCVGETRDQRDAGETHEVLTRQLSEGLDDIASEQIENNSIILAYEPVWAIGVGHSAGADTAEEAQAFCRKWVSEKQGEGAGQQVVILYGGSVSPENAKEFLDQPDIDGLLVGGASLSAQGFAKIINSYNSSYV